MIKRICDKCRKEMKVLTDISINENNKYDLCESCVKLFKIWLDESWIDNTPKIQESKIIKSFPKDTNKRTSGIYIKFKNLEERENFINEYKSSFRPYSDRQIIQTVHRWKEDGLSLNRKQKYEFRTNALEGYYWRPDDALFVMIRINPDLYNYMIYKNYLIKHKPGKIGVRSYYTLNND